MPIDPVSTEPSSVLANSGQSLSQQVAAKEVAQEAAPTSNPTPKIAESPVITEVASGPSPAFFSEQELGGKISRRRFVHAGIVLVSGAALTGCVQGIVGRSDIEITKHTLAIDHLPQSLQGMTVTFASDLHSSPFMSQDEMKNIVRMINDLNSDVILLTGDFVTSHHNEITPMINALSDLKAPKGIYACTGNHEYYVGVDMITEELEAIGIRVLRNENVKISNGDDHLYLLGIDDEDHDTVAQYVEGKPAPHVEAMFTGIPDKAATLLMCHKPYQFENFAATKLYAMLSVHTHGVRQIVLGRFGRSVMALSSLASQFVEGFYTPTKYSSNSKLYVSRGLGVVGVPFRLNCPPEITQLTLASGSQLITQ